MAALGGSAPFHAQQPPAEPAQEPRFRGGTNLVRLDVYVSAADGTAVTDLTADDFEVLRRTTRRNR